MHKQPRCLSGRSKDRADRSTFQQTGVILIREGAPGKRAAARLVSRVRMRYFSKTPRLKMHTRQCAILYKRKCCDQSERFNRRRVAAQFRRLALQLNRHSKQCRGGEGPSSPKKKITKGSAVPKRMMRTNFEATIKTPALAPCNQKSQPESVKSCQQPLCAFTDQITHQLVHPTSFQ